MEYLGAFTAGAFGGWVLETMQHSKCYDHTLAKLGLQWLPIAPLYGIGTVLILMIYKAAPNTNLLLLALACCLLFTLLECANGHLVKAIYGERSWTYTTPDAFCDRYNAVSVSLVWFALSLAALFIIRKIKK